MESLRRHLARLDHTSWTGFVILALGFLGGTIAIAARFLLAESSAVPFDAPAMGAYSSIFLVVGIVCYLCGDGE